MLELIKFNPSLEHTYISYVDLTGPFVAEKQKLFERIANIP